MFDAFRLAVQADRKRIEDASRTSSGTEAALLRAVLSQLEGDVDKARRLLQRLFRTLAGQEKAIVAELLAPILVMLRDADGVDEMAIALKNARWHASSMAFRSLAAADRGERDAARRYLAASRRFLETETDDLVRSRVLQRLARASFYLHEYDTALELADQGAQLSESLGAWRAAAASYSIVYNVHHNVTGDLDSAAANVSSWRVAADRSGDDSFSYPALVAEYEIAAQRADDARLAEVERAIRARKLPEQYGERFALVFSQALVAGARDLNAMRTLTQVLRDAPSRTPGEWALCTTLIALGQSTDRHDDDGARESVRSAVTRLGRPIAADPPHEQRYRRLARATAAAVCNLIGDHVRAERIISARESRNGHGEERLSSLLSPSVVPNASDDHIRGLHRVFQRAAALRQSAALPANLTPAEFQVLSLLARGWTAGKIAAETDRSVNTVYNHTRAILAKLAVSRAPEAVAIARERGILL